MADDELEALRLAALRTMNTKKASNNRTPNTSPRRETSATSNTSDRRARNSHQHHQSMPTSNGHSNWPSPSYNTNKYYHNQHHSSGNFRPTLNTSSNTTFARHYNRSNLVVLQTGDEKSRQDDRRNVNTRSTFGKPVVQNSVMRRPMADSNTKQKRVSLPGRFARLNDDSSDSDEDDRLDDSEPECDDNSLSPNAPLIDENSASAMEHEESAPSEKDSDEFDKVLPWNDDEDDSMTIVDNGLSNNKSSSPDREQGSTSTATPCLDEPMSQTGLQQSLTPASSTSPAENDKEACQQKEPISSIIRGVIADPEDAQVEDNASKKSDGNDAYARREAKFEPQKPCERQIIVVASQVTNGKINLVDTKIEDAMALRRKKFGEVTPVIVAATKGRPRRVAGDVRRSPRFEEPRKSPERSGKSSGKRRPRRRSSATKDQDKKNGHLGGLSSDPEHISDSKRLRSLVVMKAVH